MKRISKKTSVKKTTHKVKKRTIKKVRFEGKIDKGSIFVVCFLVILISGSFLLVGGTIPTKIPGPNNNLVGIQPFPSVGSKDSLQLYDMQGVVLTPYPTPGPGATVPSTQQKINFVNCDPLPGNTAPQIIYSSRIAATAASGNKQAIQVFYTASRALPLGTVAMKTLPVDIIQ